MTVFAEKMSWLIVLILVLIFIVFVLIFKDVIIEYFSKKLIDIIVIKKLVP